MSTVNISSFLYISIQSVFLTFCIFSYFRVRYFRPVSYDVLKLQMDFCN